MKHICNIWSAVIAVVAVTVSCVLFSGCKKDEDALTNQQNGIVRFLESSHSPRLMSEEAARESLDENPEFYTNYGNESYRYIRTMYEAGRDSRREIHSGDRVAIYFNAYVFNNTAITNSTMPYWSNRADVIEALEQTGGGLNPQFWSTEPLWVTAGGDDAVGGVCVSLVGCREGDEVEVYMTYAGAYGKNSIVGLVPKDASVAWFFTIERVN